MPLHQSLRLYQKKCLQAIKQKWKTTQTTLAIVANDGQKTTLVNELIVELLVKENPKARLMIVIHNEDFVEEVYENLYDQFGNLRRTPNIGLMAGRHNDLSRQIIMTTAKTIQGTRLNDLLLRTYKPIDYLIIHEADHAINGSAYDLLIQGMMALNPNLKVVGFSATLPRSDHPDLQSIFDDVCYMWTLQNAIEQGYLLPFHRIEVETRINLSKMPLDFYDEYDKDTLGLALRIARWDEIAFEAFINYILPRPRTCMAYFPSITLSKSFVNKLNAEGITAQHIDYTTPNYERQGIMRDFRYELLRCVSFVGGALAGVEMPQAKALLFAHPTRSENLTNQIIGRGLQTGPGKKNTLIVDLAYIDQRKEEGNRQNITCAHCQQPYRYTFTACPYCGTFAPGQSIPTTIVSDFSVPNPAQPATFGENGPNLSDLHGAWLYAPQNQVISASLGSYRGTLLILITPPNFSKRVPEGFILDNFTLIWAEDDGDITVLLSDAKYENLLKYADEYAFGPGGIATDVNAAAPWRAETATGGQLAILARFGAKPEEVFTKGEATQLISYAAADRQLRIFLKSSKIAKISPYKDPYRIIERSFSRS